MNAGDLLAGRIETAITRRGWTRDRLRKLAGVAAGTVSNFLNRTPSKDGAPSTLSLRSLEGIARALRIPLWALVHDDDAVFELFLAGDPRVEAAAAQDSTRALVTVMAILAEHRAVVAVTAEEAPARQPKPRPRRRKTA